MCFVVVGVMSMSLLDFLADDRESRARPSSAA
jgi:hypothetical protein